MDLPDPTEIDRLTTDILTATAALNARLEEAEDALAELSLGVAAEVAIDEDLTLGFGRVRDQKLWRLYVRRDDGERTLMRDCSRFVRTLAAARLDALLEELLKEVRFQTADIAQSAERAREFAESVRALKRRGL